MADEFYITDMTLADTDAVVAIEQASFPTPWSRASFIQELRDNVYAHYLVASSGREVVGYAGMWVILDEAHVTNVAVLPAWRGRKVGKELMLALLRRAMAVGARRMTLEVRMSNHVAQQLYTGLGFRISGRRPGYYTDTREDALIMWLDPIPPL